MHFSTVKGRRELIILTIWIAYIILLLFCNKPAKKLCGICTLTAEPSPSSHACQYAFSWAILPPFKYVLYGWPHGATVWDNVVWDIVWDNCVWDMFGDYTLNGKIWNLGMSFWSQNGPIVPKIIFSEKPLI